MQRDQYLVIARGIETTLLMIKEQEEDDQRRKRKEEERIHDLDELGQGFINVKTDSKPQSLESRGSRIGNSELRCLYNDLS